MWFLFNAKKRRHSDPDLLDPSTPSTTTSSVSNASAPKTAAFTEQLTLPTEMPGETENHETFPTSPIINKERNPGRFVLPSRTTAREDDYDVEPTPESEPDESE
jgi:hypothetical protein